MRVFSFLLISSLAIISSLRTREPATIVIHQESLCKYSLGFDRDQLPKLLSHPNRDLLFKSIDIVWYGNTKEQPDSAAFNRKFICQHGANECYGNYMLNCAELNFVQTNDLFKFYTCLSKYALDNLSNVNFDYGVRSCTNILLANIIIFVTILD